MDKSSAEYSIVSLVPDAILSGNDDQRLEYFKSEALTVQHPKLIQAVEELEWGLRGRIDQDYLMLFGPSGVGKSTAMRLLVNRMNQTVVGRNRAAIFIETLASESNKFDWRGLYVDILEELSAPFPDRALSEVARKIGEEAISTVAMETYRANPTVPALKRRVLRTIADRKLRLLALDEAINFLADSNGARLNSETETTSKSTAHIVKSLVNKSYGSVLFAGAYDLFDHAFATGQLARRADIVHFQRYTETAEDIAAFAQAFVGLLSHFPAPVELDPTTCAADMFEQAIGSVGLTRKILQRALVNCARRQLPLTNTVLKSGFFDKLSFSKLKKESAQGEEIVRDYFDEAQRKPLDKVSEDFAPASSAAGKPFERKPDRAWQGEVPSVG
jgi:hypothetical protein